MFRGWYALLGFFCCALAAAAEIGVLPSKTWDLRRLQADQSLPDLPFYSLVQTKEGLIYVGDSSGLLEFDSRKWRRLPLDSPGTISLLGAPRAGGLVVGGPEFLRYFPTLTTPLAGLDPAPWLKDGLRGSGDFWEFAEDAEQWCARSPLLLVCYAEGKFRGYRSKSEFGRLFQGQDAIYLMENGVGLNQVGLDGPKLIAGGELFANCKVYSLVESADRQITAVTKQPSAIWQWNRGGTPTQNLTATLDNIDFPVGIGWQPLPGRLALPEDNRGVAIIRSDGGIEERIEAENLGVSPGAQGIIFDREGGLWVTWRSAISRVEYPSRITLFPMPNSVYGEPLLLARTRLGITTWRGPNLYVLAPQAGSSRWAMQAQKAETPVILKVSRVGEVDYLATIRGLWALGGTTPALPNELVIDFTPSLGDSGRLWVGLRNTLVLLRQGANDWDEVARLPVSFEVVSILQSDPRTLWLGSMVGRVTRITLDPAGGLSGAAVTEFGQESGLPTRAIGIRQLDDRMLFQVDRGGFLEFRDGYFQPSTMLPMSETGEIVDARVIDTSQVLVTGSNATVRLLKRDLAGVFRIQRSIFDDITGIGVSRSILVDPDGVVWLAADAGVVRVDPRVEVPSAQPQQVLIREVTNDQDSLFSGAGAVPALTVKAGSNLRFGFALPSYRAPEMNRYRSKLRPSQGIANWGEWSNETHRDFTNLEAGEFVFEVQARDAVGMSGGSAVVALTVTAPWYRRSWAIFSFWMLGLSLIWMAAHWRLVALRARSAELERLVAVKTEALQVAATTDPLTGLCNRHRFGQWVREEVPVILARASNAEPQDPVDLFVAAIDLDHFKSVNDEHGHAAGDAVLKAVAGRLLQFKRKADLIFRFGGEEFVYLGIQCHRDDCRLLAERIIGEIAALNVELESGVLIQPTASLGWSVFPFYRERPDLFSLDFVITIADRALYLAKQEGRNRACGHLPNLAVDLLDRTQADWRSKVFQRHPDFLRRV